jgi:signal transduction histidine kinase
LVVYNKIIKFEVKDNGYGAGNAAKIENMSKGMGLKGIEERSIGIGGKVIIDGSKGFSVITLLPIEN